MSGVGLASAVVPVRDVEQPGGGVDRSDRLAALAVAALVTEARLTPKPGLVDGRGGGAHRDMDLTLLLSSAATLQPFLAQLAQAGAMLPLDVALRERVGKIGRSAEAAMLDVTGGVNTHRGALWCVGLLVTAAGAWPRNATSAALCRRAARLARLPDRFAASSDGRPSHGALMRERYGVGGARAEACEGFPHVRRAALPLLRRPTTVTTSPRDQPETDTRRLDALLATISVLPDTCLLYRGGRSGLALAQSGAQRVLAAGGAGSSCGRRELERFDRRLCAHQLSPGGSADLLAAALFLRALEV